MYASLPSVYGQHVLRQRRLPGSRGKRWLIRTGVQHLVSHDGDNYRSGIMRRFLKFTQTTTSAANGSQAVSSKRQAPALQEDNSLPSITVLAAVNFLNQQLQSL